MKLHILLNTYNVDVISNNQTALHYAAWYNCQDVAKELIELGAIVNANGLNYGTPLHMAARAGSVDIGKLLIQNGADVSIT